ncbi:MAG TPA: DNA polymerase [Opitutae bacterium]|nr:DNA polymerase [Opitutaceae bacterium]HCR29016.1 DNA polymerase [Opitutae bacterium]
MLGGDSGRSLCGLWISPEGQAYLAWDRGKGPRESQTVSFAPFVWALERAVDDLIVGADVSKLSGEAPYNRLVKFEDIEDYKDFVKQKGRSNSIDWIRNLEQQYLLSREERLYAGFSFNALRRMQLDIETACSEEGGFSDSRRPNDRIIAIGLKLGQSIETISLDSFTDESERALLQRLNEKFAEWDPDVVEGHNIFKFDLDYLRTRAKRLKIPINWGRFGQTATFRKSRLRVAERWIDYPRCDLPGRAVVDTFLLTQVYDATARELMSYGLKEVARFLGVTPEDGGGRTYIEGTKIQEAFMEDHDRFLSYLEDDLRETGGVADRLLPTYFEQTKAFPTTLQEACLRGTASKVDLVFQEKYFHLKAACPMPAEPRPYEGAYTASFKEGVFKQVLHFDVASLYPSILLMMGRNPHTDTEGVFIPTLRGLRDYRMKYKKLAQESKDEKMALEYEARQSSFKILINSFYGYLGFSGARFGDAELASQVAAKGREILKSLITYFESVGCSPLEADTDGIYVEASEYYDSAVSLLADAQSILPEGIELEYDGRYESMFCYKAKNYALYDGSRVTIRGSAMRSRGLEPFLRSLTQSLIWYLLGASEEDPAVLASEMESKIKSGSCPIELLAKSEILSQNPEAYQKKIEAGGKPRRASAEVALLLGERVRMGDRVSYYIGPKEKGQTANWQRAQPIEWYGNDGPPYDPTFYLKKLDDWRKRYDPFHVQLGKNGAQKELFS